VPYRTEQVVVEIGSVLIPRCEIRDTDACEAWPMIFGQRNDTQVRSLWSDRDIHDFALLPMVPGRTFADGFACVLLRCWNAVNSDNFIE
jgi:hypothetical protein